MIIPPPKQPLLTLLVQLSNDRMSIYENQSCLHAAGNGEMVTLNINDRRFYRALAGGSVSTAEAYINGWWDCSDLYVLMRLAAGNIDTLNARLDGGWRRGWRRLTALFSASRRRLFSRLNSKRDIAFHYDMSNEFFSLFLDETLAYSCAIFPDLSNATAAALPQASRNKLARICGKLELTEQDHLLDLGCGWGSMAFHAAANHRCPVTAITLSPAQHDYLKAQAARHEQVQAVLSDYRDFQPPRKFSKISSVEMIEAAGEKHFGTYFRRIRDMLTSNGLAQVQAILIPDARYHQARRDKDFIRHYIFPGGMLPSMEMIRHAAAGNGLALVASEHIGAHYAPTLLAWRQQFNARLEQIKKLGFNDRFCRLWNYYFCYCAGAFAANTLDVAQLVFTPTRR